MKNLDTIKLGLYEKGIPLSFGWDEKFETAKNAGFDFIELSIDGLEPRIHRLEWSDQYLNHLRDTAAKHQMPFQTMALTANRYFPLGDSDGKIRSLGKAIVRRSIEIADILGISVIQIAAYDVYGKESTRQTRSLFQESLAELLEDAGPKDKILAVEMLEDVPHLSSIRQGIGMINALANPCLKLYADLGNVASIGIDPAEDLCFGGNSIAACHIKDALPSNCRNVPYGTGIVDFNRCMQYFKRCDFNGVFVAEVWSDEEPSFIPYLNDVSKFIRNIMR